MAVPAEIRAVPRPVNTIVDDSGTNSRSVMQSASGHLQNIFRVVTHNPKTEKSSDTSLITNMCL